MIQADYSNLPQNDNNSIVPEGDYEVVIKEVKEGVSTQKGTPFVQFELIIRNDINQQFKNKHLWYVVYDTPITREKGQYPGNIWKVLQNAGVPDKSTFKDYQDVTRTIYGRPVVATVKHQDYNGNKQARVTYISATKFPQCQHNFRVEGQGSTANNQGSSQQYNNQNQNNYGPGSQQPSQGYNQNYNNGQQGYNNNKGYGNQNGGTPNQGNTMQNIAGTGQAWQGNQQQNNVQQPVDDDDLPF